MKKLTVTNIACSKSTNGSGNDDVMLMVQCDGGPPIRFPLDGTYPMDDGDTQALPDSDGNAAEFLYQNDIYISVWDHDGWLNTFNQADMLGNFALKANGQSGDYDIWGVDSSEYTLSVNVSDVANPEAQHADDIPPTLLQSAQQALTDFANSSDGQDLLNSRGHDDLEDLSTQLTDALSKSGSVFTDVLNTVQQYDPIKAISLGLMGQVEIFIGISGAFGYAMDIENLGETSAIFAGGGIVEGVDGGIQATLALGFWFQTTAEIGGFYEGAEVDIDDGVGLTFAAFASRADKDDFKSGGEVNLKFAKVLFAGLDIGIDDGVEAEEAYFFAGHIADYPCFQSGTYDNKARMEVLECLHKDSGGDRHDDVFMLYTIDGDTSTHYRYAMWNEFEMSHTKDGEPDDNIWQCGNIVKFNDSIAISLYINEDDPDKPLDTLTFSKADMQSNGGSLTQRFNEGDDPEYELTVSLV